MNTTTNKFLKNQYKEVLIYIITNSNNTNRLGTTIILNKNLSLYIYKIIELPECAIIIILKFKNRIEITATSIYNKFNKDKRISREIIDYLKKYSYIKYQIIMGNLNENQ